QKLLPAPRNSTARTARLLSHSSATAFSSLAIARSSALPACGRLRVTYATFSRTSNSTGFSFDISNHSRQNPIRVGLGWLRFIFFPSRPTPRSSPGGLSDIHPQLLVVRHTPR